MTRIFAETGPKKAEIIPNQVVAYSGVDRGDGLMDSPCVSGPDLPE